MPGADAKGTGGPSPQEEITAVFSSPGLNFKTSVWLQEVSPGHGSET